MPLRDSFMGRLFFLSFFLSFFLLFAPKISKSLTYVDQCASLKEFNKLKCSGLFSFFFFPRRAEKADETGLV